MRFGLKEEDIGAINAIFSLTNAGSARNPIQSLTEATECIPWRSLL